jgi:hypothetical protein
MCRFRHKSVLMNGVTSVVPNVVGLLLFPVARIEFTVRLRQWNAASSCETGLQSVAERNWFCHSLAASVGAIVATVIA